jgi:hypothetical protein
MPSRLVPALMCAAAAALTAACAIQPDAPGSAAVADHAAAPQLSHQRLILSEGYSMLHTDAGHLDMLGFVLYVKSQSADVDQMVTEISKYGDTLKDGLERLARDYPGVRLDLDPLPEMEKRKRSAIASDRGRYFAPVIGHGGVEYERTVLIGMLGALNHESHLCQAMAEEEPDPGLKKFLLAAQARFTELDLQVEALLERSYFRMPVKVARP